MPGMMLKFFLILLIGPFAMLSCGSVNLAGDWRTADRSSAGIAPPAKASREAVIQAYAARAFNWRGIFAVHTWIATKPAGESGYTVHQVIGWHRYSNLPVVVTGPDIPDRSWYGNPPRIILDLRGDEAGRLIPRIEQAVLNYPYRHDYTVWPDPNSNTFTAWVARRVPELRLELPTTAIGKDYLAKAAVYDRAPSGTGYQVSLFGVAGVMAARREGLEFNFLGLSFGIDPQGPALKLPGIERIGFGG